MEQHFLTHPEALATLVEAAAIVPSDRVLELGAGGGTVAARLPPCSLTLVELERVLAEALEKRFPHAEVLCADALEALTTQPFNVLLSNLPHALTQGVLERLEAGLNGSVNDVSSQSFKRALVTTHETETPKALAERFPQLHFKSLLKLHPSDFTPPQPFGSRLFLVVPRAATAP